MAVVTETPSPLRYTINQLAAAGKPVSEKDRRRLQVAAAVEQIDGPTGHYELTKSWLRRRYILKWRPH